jgi:diguanylate cyclase (GGDEF)-like protein
MAVDTSDYIDILEGLAGDLGRESSSAVQGELANVLNPLFLAIVKVDLSQDTVCILQSADRQDSVSYRFCWQAYLAHYAQLFWEQNQKLLLEQFSSAHLLKLYESGQQSCSLDLPIARHMPNWVTITAFLHAGEHNRPFAYITVQRSSEYHLQKSILDLYVYDLCDYFIYLDARRNSYVMLSSNKSGAPLPAAQCNDYAAEVVRYAHAHVVAQDREMVIREMSLDRVLARLEQQQTHAFSYGIVDPALGYTRKRLEYRYYDRSAYKILLSRTDATAVYQDELDRHRELQAALDRAQTDSLTGLLNHRVIQEKVSAVLAQGPSLSALMFIDLDNFKSVNDTLGHDMGDELLRRFSSMLRQEMRPSDLIGRVGGDEFIVFLNTIASREYAASCAQRLCTAMEALDFGAALHVPVSCSIGIAVSPDDGQDYKTLVKKADTHVYRAKLAGKNRFFF